MATIVSFDDLKSILDLTSGTTYADYPDLELIADSVHDALENYIGRSISVSASVGATGLVDGTYIDLESLPIASVSAITVDGVDVSSYMSIVSSGVLLSTSFVGAYSVTYTGGFDVIPADIYRAELMQTIYEYQNRTNIGTTSFSNAGGTSTTKEGFNILNETKRIMVNYMHPKKFGF